MSVQSVLTTFRDLSQGSSGVRGRDWPSTLLPGPDVPVQAFGYTVKFQIACFLIFQLTGDPCPPLAFQPVSGDYGVSRRIGDYTYVPSGTDPGALPDAISVLQRNEYFASRFFQLILRDYRAGTQPCILCGAARRPSQAGRLSPQLSQAPGP